MGKTDASAPKFVLGAVGLVGRTPLAEREKPPRRNPGGQCKRLRLYSALYRIAALAVLALGGRDGQAHLLADGAGKEPAQGMRLPVGRLEQLLCSRAARPLQYAERRPQVSTLASRTMRWGGVVLVAFIVFHILHMTTGTVHPSFAAGDVYHNLVTGLRVWPVAIFYLLAMAALGLHLYHGVWSSARTLGVARPTPHPFHRPVAVVVAVAVAVGFALIPVAVLAGWIR